MPYDLYGKYYSSRKEAMRMERYQMREIDAGIAEREAQQKSQEVAYWKNIAENQQRQLQQEAQMKHELTAGILPKD